MTESMEKIKEVLPDLNAREKELLWAFGEGLSAAAQLATQEQEKEET